MADGFAKYPLNLMNIHSVQEINARVPKDERMQDIDARRFRANILGTLIHLLPFIYNVS